MGTMTLTRLKSAKFDRVPCGTIPDRVGINGHPEVKKYFFWCQNASPRDYGDKWYYPAEIIADNDIILRKLRKKGVELITFFCFANFSLSAPRLSRYFLLQSK